MVSSPLLIIYGAVFLFALLLAYWRTLWVGRKYRVPVAACSLLNTVSLVAILLLAKEVWQTRSWQSFALLTIAATGYLLTEWWGLRLKRRQENDNAANKRDRQ